MSAGAVLVEGAQETAVREVCYLGLGRIDQVPRVVLCEGKVGWKPTLPRRAKDDRMQWLVAAQILHASVLSLAAQLSPRMIGTSFVVLKWIYCRWWRPHLVVVTCWKYNPRE